MKWWEAAPELTMVTACGAVRHRLLWRSGMLELVDHPRLDSELAMVAFGGPEPACVSLYHLWHDAVADGGFLGEWVDETRLSPAWFSWLAMALERMRSEGFHEFLRGLPPDRAQRMGEFLHRFPRPWLDRAAATVSEAVCEGEGVICDLAPGLLSSAIAQRLRRAFVDSIGGRQLAVGTAALVPLQISVGRGTDGLSVTGELVGVERGVAITVDHRWLHRVWAAGAGVIDGCLVLAITAGVDHRPGSSLAEVVRWWPVDGRRHRPVIETLPVGFSSGVWSPA